MPVVYKSALVGHSAKQMYDLINDLDSYPDFLPWCRSTRLVSHQDNRMVGEIEVARVGVRQCFTTCNYLYPYEKIEIRLQDGPFKRLQGEWRLVELREDACKVELELDFEFSGKLINSAFGKVFGQIANTLVDAFCKRANEVCRDN